MAGMPEHDALQRGGHRARVGDVVAEVRAVVDAGDDQLGLELDQPERGEAHAVHRRAVGGVADGAVARGPPPRPTAGAGGDAARRGAAVGVGAITASSTPGTSSSARRMACRPIGADAVVVGEEDLHRLTQDSRARARDRDDSVPDCLQVQPVRARRCRRPRCAGGPPAAGRTPHAASAPRPRPASCPPASAPSGAGSCRPRSRSPARRPPRRATRPRDLAIELPVDGLGAGEGGEVVPARQQGGAFVQRAAVAADTPVQRALALEDARHGSPARGSGRCAPARIAAGVEALGRLLAGQHPHVGRQQRVQRPRRRRRARVAGHLPPGVHTRVGAPRHRQRYRLGQHPGQCLPPARPAPCARPAGPPSRRSPPRRTPAAAARPGLTAPAGHDQQVLGLHRERAVAAGPAARELELLLDHPGVVVGGQCSLAAACGGEWRSIISRNCLWRVRRPARASCARSSTELASPSNRSRTVSSRPQSSMRGCLGVRRAGSAGRSGTSPRPCSRASRRSCPPCCRAAPRGTAPRPPPAAAARSSPRTPTRRSRSGRPRTAASSALASTHSISYPSASDRSRPRRTIPGARSDATTLAPSAAHAMAKLPSPAATSSTSCPPRRRMRRPAPRRRASAARTARSTRPCPSRRASAP